MVEYLTSGNGVREEWSAYLSGVTYPAWGTEKTGKYEPFKLRRWEWVLLERLRIDPTV